MLSCRRKGLSVRSNSIRFISRWVSMIDRRSRMLEGLELRRGRPSRRRGGVHACRLSSLASPPVPRERGQEAWDLSRSRRCLSEGGWVALTNSDFCGSKLGVESRAN
mmetsp:Transcript_15160/g.26464  ORF Transcript_15160/g.26464 Transcript_15160/m.26464 type:complete len:107 (+) Transcript_15160:163-483(+)